MVSPGERVVGWRDAGREGILLLSVECTGGVK